MSEVVLHARKFEQDGFTVIVKHIYDDGRQCETPEELQKNYEGVDEAEKKKYFAQDKRRYLAWTRDKWQYVGVAVSIHKQTSSNWADGGLEVGRASVWGIESDSGAKYFKRVEEEEIMEAFAEVDKLKQALCGNRE